MVSCWALAAKDCDIGIFLILKFALYDKRCWKTLNYFSTICISYFEKNLSRSLTQFLIGWFGFNWMFSFFSSLYSLDTNLCQTYRQLRFFSLFCRLPFHSNGDILCCSNPFSLIGFHLLIVELNLSTMKVLFKKSFPVSLSCSAFPSVMSIKWLSLSLSCLVLVWSILLGGRPATPACFLVPLTCHVFFHPFTLKRYWPLLVTLRFGNYTSLFCFLPYYF